VVIASGLNNHRTVGRACATVDTHPVTDFTLRRLFDDRTAAKCGKSSFCPQAAGQSAGQPHILF
jgi:hypothetical protein